MVDSGFLFSLFPLSLPSGEGGRGKEGSTTQHNTTLRFVSEIVAKQFQVMARGEARRVGGRRRRPELRPLPPAWLQPVGVVQRTGA